MAVCDDTQAGIDHAELARLAEWRDRLRADPGRAAHFGSPYADKPMQNGRTYWNIDLADDITSLLAENAALRERLEWIWREADQNALNGVRLVEAERKLAEAVSLLGDVVFVRKDNAGQSAEFMLSEVITKARTFLSSKEAERG